MPEFDRNPDPLRHLGQEVLQSRKVIAEERGELDQKHSEFIPQVPQIVNHPFEPTLGFEESLVVGEKPWRFDAHQETWRQSFLPGFKRRWLRPTVKSGIDLHGREAGTVKPEPGVDGRVQRVENAFPMIVTPSRGANVQCHTMPARSTIV
jgi:hypothetical protein